MKQTQLFAGTVAAALLAAAGAASAQSSVTIYGRFNVTGEYQESNDVKTYRLVNNASRIGFKGTEDLGGGLKAGFVLEHGFNVDTGSQSQGAFWARQSEVNLSGGFGMLRAGNFTSEAYYATSDYIGMHNHETGTSSDALYAYIGRNTNKIAYRTPEFIKGLTMEAAVSANENQAAGIRTWDFALNYGAGPLHIGIGYEKAGSANQYAASVLYEIGPIIVGALVQRDKNGFGSNFGTRTNYRGSLAYIAGASEFHVNVGKAGDYSKVASSDALQYTLGYNYNLSKRTKVYTYYTVIDDSRAGIYTSGPRAGGKEGEFSSLAFGLRHNF
jgi:predicted porin